MQHTFHLKAGNLTPAFVEQLREIFGDGELKIVVESTEPNGDTDAFNHVSRLERHYRSMMELRELFKDARIDPTIDISKLANEVNL
ncbi:hypothetical protein GCM10010967_25080 [Dyadobacter beijingensis]|uniref:Uncharacterized protein n=1 Tax=Dyadobacter beijingensis TaxID=365489 RepID=A0ABQ2HT99_9BACT|nr:hypothetical protein [Dyadobacter beijingensis]GGM90999.1 hypothetical protein GCM10010967_25080 [Dyadobacter beijingensis]